MIQIPPGSRQKCVQSHNLSFSPQSSPPQFESRDKSMQPLTAQSAGPSMPAPSVGVRARGSQPVSKVESLSGPCEWYLCAPNLVPFQTPRERCGVLEPHLMVCEWPQSTVALAYMCGHDMAATIPWVGL